MQRVAIVSFANGREAFQALLDCVFQLNCLYLAAVPDCPPLYESGVRFRPEDRDCDDGTCQEERFCTIPVVLRARSGDCDDLAPWRAAELYVRHGVQARPEIVQINPRSWHVVVRLPDGQVEDPSALLGMHEYNAARRAQRAAKAGVRRRPFGGA